ncbi:hypothetical protein H6P81_005073 [Aristolochia fimbriata]|uniref:Aminotransferase class I/classII large domain-containing protein n=1 Tax=Aristolochia fimbriata TaxID=158543 RepID=A0AAV7EUU7_ARIFI|nr:hypothetical protein H6P81_005073 [Aristolochia fimbriata]
MAKLEGSFELSKLALADGHSENSPYFDGWKAYDLNPYHPLLNPCGIMQMGLAENQLGTALVDEWVEKHTRFLAWKDTLTSFKETALYQDYHGFDSFRKALARFMEEVRDGRAKIDPDGLVLTAGATAANEILTFCIANPGETLLVPTPYYAGFDRDLRWRTGVEIEPVECSSDESFQITLPALERAYRTALKKGKTVKAVFITNPSNPLGLTISPHTLYQVLDFAREKSIHVIADEVYAGTVFSSPPFTSILELIQSSNKYGPETVHIVYSLSKDLGLPGFRVGALYSSNQTVRTAARRMSSFSLVSSQTQALLTSLLLDSGFTQNYLLRVRKELRRRHGDFLKGLREVGVDCVEGNSGLFCWVNLGKLLRIDDWEGELQLWRVVLEKIGLNISPGCSFHCSEPGWFRVCFGNMSEEDMNVALGRIRSFMSNNGGAGRGDGGGSKGMMTIPEEAPPMVRPHLSYVLDAEQQA